MDYVKASKSNIPQGQLEGAKYGKKQYFYLRDPGFTFEGIDATDNIGGVQEVEVSAECTSRGTAVNLDVWNRLTDIEDFIEEVAKPHAAKLALSVEKDIIKKTGTVALQAVAGPAAFSTLTEASALLTEAANAGDKYIWNAPTVNGKIAATGLANFIPSDIQKEIYHKNYLGEYAGASVLNMNLMPTVTAVSVSAVTWTADSAGKIKLTGASDAMVGLPVELEGVKLVDLNGIKTELQVRGTIAKDDNNDYIVDGARLGVPGEGDKWATNASQNPNCYADAVSGACANVLTAGKKYRLGVCRTKDSLGFDQYKFMDLPGSVNSTQTVDGITLKYSEYSNGTKLEVLSRLDFPYIAYVNEPRRQVTIFYELD